MHELSLIEGILDMVRDSAVENNIRKVNRIKLVIGRFSMVMTDSMHFCYEVLSSQDPLFMGSILEIEERDLMIRCRSCEQEFVLYDKSAFLCPSCGKADVEIISGRELYIDSYEGDDNES